ncbi:VOC family protein [Mesorhizobium sp. M1380]|uniref:VOC family protein n=1 Tax=Mesorhizobium sp. M1380 TaxID=2957093 RepID=UPI003339C88B
MTETGLLGVPHQLGFMVDDVKAAAISWGEKCGVGPFYFFDTAPYEILYRGKESAPVVTLAFAYMGTTQVELISQHDSAPSVYADFKKNKGEGLIHMGRFVPNPKSDSGVVARRGCEMLQFNWDGDHAEDCVYYETVSHPGALVEFIKATPARTARAELMQRLAREWNGSDPYRPFARLQDDK